MFIEVMVFGGLEKTVSGAAFGKPMKMKVSQGSTVNTLLQELKVPEGKVFTILINGLHSNLEEMLKSGDRVALFPPVAGG